jgi:hypothetical protein
MKSLVALAFVAIVVTVAALGFQQAAPSVASEPPACSTFCNCGAPTGNCQCLWDCGGYWATRDMTCVQWCAQGCGRSPC